MLIFFNNIVKNFNHYEVFNFNNGIYYAFGVYGYTIYYPSEEIIYIGANTQRERVRDKEYIVRLTKEDVRINPSLAYNPTISKFQKLGLLNTALYHLNYKLRCREIYLPKAANDLGILPFGIGVEIPDFTISSEQWEDTKLKEDEHYSFNEITLTYCVQPLFKNQRISLINNEEKRGCSYKIVSCYNWLNKKKLIISLVKGISIYQLQHASFKDLTDYSVKVEFLGFKGGILPLYCRVKSSKENKGLRIRKALLQYCQDITPDFADYFQEGVSFYITLKLSSFKDLLRYSR